MKEIFITAFIVFVIIEIFLAIKFKASKKKVSFKSTIISSSLFIILAAAILLNFIYIPYFILILTIIMLIIHTYIGYFLNYYNKSTIFDRYVHFYGSFTLSLLFYYLFDNFIVYGGAKEFKAFFIFTLGISIGAIYEVIEYIIDTRHNTELQRSLKDTNFDILSNIIGSFTSSIFSYFVFL